MKKSIRVALMCLLAVFAVGAQAQRTLVPVVDFVDIPVTVATSAPVTSEQVRQAFVEAGEAANWKIVPAGDGTLEAIFVKQNKHTVVATIRYDAHAYSVLYKSSVNMKWRERQYPSVAAVPPGAMQSQAERAIRKQQALFANRPESRHARPHPQAVIHPFYEHWVHNLLEAVRRKLAKPA